MSVQKIDKDNFAAKVMKSEKTVLLDFWAAWCGPCQILSPLVEGIAEDNGTVLVGKVNVDEEAELAQAFGITSIPTLIVMQKGQIIRQLIGVHSREEIEALLESTSKQTENQDFPEAEGAAANIVHHTEGTPVG